MSEIDRTDDERLSRLLRAVRAEPDPALWIRARARIEASEEESLVSGRACGLPAGFWNWLTRPAALATSVALFVAVIGAGLMVGRNATPSGVYVATTLTDELLADNDGGNANAPAATAPEMVPSDSGATP